MMNRIKKPVCTFLSRLVGGSHYWGYLRLVGAIIIIGMFLWLGRLVWQEPGAEPVSLYYPIGWRYWVIPIAAFAGVMLLAVNFLAKLYPLKQLKSRIRYIIASTFALLYPVLVIKNGEIRLEEDEDNLMDVVGGPGYVRVLSGSAVVLERLKGWSRALGAGRHFVTRMEHIRDTASLEDQHGKVDMVLCTTKDGIRVFVRDIRYRYRLHTGITAGDFRRRTQREPYPYSVDALRKYAYNRNFNGEAISNWASTIEITVKGVITEYVRQHQFDEISTPREIDDRARAQIRFIMKSEPMRRRLRTYGAELLWFDSGHIEPVDPQIGEMRVGKWGVRWKGQARVTRAYAEAQRVAEIELGRAEEQANLFISIVNALEEVSLSGNVDENIANIVVLRTAQVLDALTERDPSDGG